MPFSPRWEGDFPSLGYAVGGHIERYLGIRLMDEQAQRLVCLYRLNPVTGERVVRRAALRRPKGAGKSPEGGYIGFGELTGPVVFDGWGAQGLPVGRPHPAPWVQLAAVSEDQTDNVLVWLYELLADLPETLAELHIDLGRTRVYLKDRQGRIEPVTAAAGSREGQPVTYAVLDQTEAWYAENGGVRLAAVMRRNAAKTGGWTYELQNAPEPGDGSVADRTARAWQRGQEGVLFDTREPVLSGLPDLGELQRRVADAGGWSPDLAADRSSLLSALGEAYGESATRGFVSLDRLADEIVDADTEPADGYRFYLNVGRPAAARAFDHRRWLELAAPLTQVPDGEVVVLGVDGARFEDALAIVGTGVLSGHQFVVGVWERPERAPEDYEHPAEEIDAAMSAVFDRWEVWRAYVDPQWIDHLFSRWQGRWGERAVVPWLTHRYRAMAHALRSYRSAMVGGDLSHCGDAAMSTHVFNARRRPHPGIKDDDGRPMWTIRKDRPGSVLKIDAAMAGCLSWEARGDAVADGSARPRRRARAMSF